MASRLSESCISAWMRPGAARLSLLCNFTMTAIALLTAACSSEYDPKLSRADVEKLATQMQITVGDTPLVFPRAAMLRREAKPFAPKSSLTYVELLVRPYGWSESEPEMRKICPLLERQWVASVCDNPWAPLKQAMPENNFSLIDRDQISIFDYHWTVGGERRSDQLRAMNLTIGQTQTVCDKVQRSTTLFCTAAQMLSPRLIAVWTVWDGPQEKHRAMAKREGRAISAFVRNAIAPQENYASLMREICRLRRPGSQNGPSGVDPCASPN